MNTPIVAPSDHEEATWRLFVETRDALLREALFQVHIGYAKAIAYRLYRNRPRDDVEFADYLQFACVGLLESIERFEPDGEAGFRTYSTRRIEGSILDGVEKLTDAQQQIALKRRLRKERLDSITPKPAKRTGVEAMEALAEVAVGLAIGLMLEDTGMFAAEEQASRAPSPYETLAWTQTKTRLLEFTSALPERERSIVEYHYLHGMRFEQIAKMLELTPGRISQLHRAALQMIRQNASQTGTMFFTG